MKTTSIDTPKQRACYTAAPTFENTLAVDSRQITYLLSPLCNLVAASLTEAHRLFATENLKNLKQRFQTKGDIWGSCDDSFQEFLGTFVEGALTEAWGRLHPESDDDEFEILVNTLKDGSPVEAHTNTLPVTTTTSKGYRKLGGRVKVTRSPLDYRKVAVAFATMDTLSITVQLPAMQYTDGVTCYKYDGTELALTVPLNRVNIHSLCGTIGKKEFKQIVAPALIDAKFDSAIILEQFRQAFSNASLYHYTTNGGF